MANLRLKELRNQKKLTQADVAAHLQVARESYSRYESGEREMPYDSLILLAELFGVSVDYILGRDDKNPLVLDERETTIINTLRTVDAAGESSFNLKELRDARKRPKHTSHANRRKQTEQAVGRYKKQALKKLADEKHKKQAKRISVSKGE